MRATAKAGFSFLEVLVSLLVLTVGVLAVAKSMTAMNHMLAAASVLTGVAVAGTNKVETLLSHGCSGETASGATTVGGVVLRWSVVGDPGAIQIEVVADYPLDYAKRVDSIPYFLVCSDEP